MPVYIQFISNDDYIKIMIMDDLICTVESHNKKCGKPAIISAIHLGRTTNMCNNHYAATVVGEVEESKITFDNCEICGNGVMEYRNVTYNDTTNQIMAWYKCSHCGEFKSYERKIVNGNIE